MRLDHRLVDQRGPVRDDLLDLRTAAREARHARRAIQHEWRDLSREALDVGLAVAANAEAKLDLRRIVRLASERLLQNISRLEAALGARSGKENEAVQQT